MQAEPRVTWLQPRENSHQGLEEAKEDLSLDFGVLSPPTPGVGSEMPLSSGLQHHKRTPPAALSLVFVVICDDCHGELT